MDIQSFLIAIGANMPGFEGGLVTGGVIVILVLLVVFVISRIFAKKDKVAKSDSASKKDDTKELINSYEEKINELKKENESVAKAKLEEGSVFSLVLLQREGRLVDFLMENIDAFEDAQIGAAVRQIHAGCSKVLNENFSVKPLFNTPEGEKVTMDEIKPAEVRMSGNVPEKAPYKGILRHKGWTADKVELPKRTGKVNDKVICPAEVEF